MKIYIFRFLNCFIFFYTSYALAYYIDIDPSNIFLKKVLPVLILFIPIYVDYKYIEKNRKDK